jgi:hypothetical protein
VSGAVVLRVRLTVVFGLLFSAAGAAVLGGPICS